LSRSDPRLHRVQVSIQAEVLPKKSSEILCASARGGNDVGDVEACKTAVDSCSVADAGLTAATDAYVVLKNGL
jgi:hypothetical protein